MAPIHDFDEVRRLGSTGQGGALKYQQIASQFSKAKQKHQKGKQLHQRAETTTAMTSTYLHPIGSTFASEFNLNNSVMRFYPYTSQQSNAATPLISTDNFKAQYLNNNSLRLNVFSS